MRITGNTVLIAGGTSGIGLALALALRDAGNHVIVGGRRQHLLDQIVAEHPGIDAVVLDVTDPDSIARCSEQVTGAHPELNVLINMAGIMVSEDLRDPASLPIAESTIATNLLGPIRMTSAFVPFLMKQDDATIVNVTSGLAYVPLPDAPTYSATKAAMHSFSDSLRVQLADTSVRVVELVPPLTGTTLHGADSNPHAMPLDEFVAEATALLTAEPDARQILVERVRRQRFAEANGAYDEVLATQSALTS